jgi:class 3 adenylate cyclase/tetratricopeptide (TPR) repeat protein
MATPPMTNCRNCGAPAAPGARFCASCGAELTAPAAEERKLATILFADVIGSTDLGEQLDPERLRALLQEYFAAMSRVIQEWGGTVEKYIGDAILAVFGVPTAREDDAVRALQAATDMLATLERLNGGFEARHGVRLGVRIGVNTGEVLAPVGARPAGQFLVSGDPVNVAARLEQSAEPGTVLVGERTWSAAKHAFEFADPVSLAVKGKAEPLAARRLGRPVATEPEKELRLQAPMIGRERELETLLGLLDEAIETEQPRFVVLSGPAGIGKSRMLREFIASANAAHPGLDVLRGRCLAAGHGITFWAPGEVLRQACDISLDEPAESAATKLRNTTSALLAPLGLRPADLDETIFALADSANLALPGNPLEAMDPESAGEVISRAWARFLTALGMRSPTAVLLEDLHWADERVVELLDLLAGRLRGRLVVVATARPEFIESHPGFGTAEDVTMIPLRPLTDVQTDRLAAELLGESGALQALLAEVRQKAEGNPFFLEEILQRLVDEGALVQEDGRWRATERAATVTLPDTIHGLLAARIDGLPPDEKALLQQAAVVGRIFWPGSLRSAESDKPVAETLRSLERRGLVSARPVSTIEGEREYTFRHVLIRDVAYASVPKARRARAHAEVGRWIEELAGDRVDEFGELLAYHYTTAAAGEDADLAWADDPDGREEIRRRAFDVLLRAGLAARHRFAVAKALELHERALEVSANDDERARAHEAIGDDHEALFHMDEAVASYFAALDAVRDGDGEAAALPRLAVRLARATMRWGAFRDKPDTDRIRSLLGEALAMETEPQTRAALLIGRSAIWRGEDDKFSTRDALSVEEAIRLVEQGLEIARELDNVELMEWGEQILELRAYLAGDYAKERASVERLAALVDRLPSRRQKAEILEELAQTRWQQGRFRDSLATAERSLELANDLSAHERMHATATAMNAALVLGEWDRVAELLPWHVEAAAEEPDVSCSQVRGGPFVGATVLAWRGETELARTLVPPELSEFTRKTFWARSHAARYASLVGRSDVASEIADQMLSDPQREQIPEGFESFVEALELLDRPAHVAQELPTARRLAEASVVLQPIADRAEGKLALRDGRRDDARQLLERALRRFEELEMPFEAARTRELLADASEGEERTALLGDAWAAYERLGATPSVERVRERLSAVGAAT